MKKVTLLKVRNEMWEIEGQVLYRKQKILDGKIYNWGNTL